MKKNDKCEEYIFQGKLWIKIMVLLIISVFSLIVLLPNVLNGEMFSLTLLIVILFINLFAFYKQYKNQGKMIINNIGIQIITWNGFSHNRQRTMKEYQWNEIKKMELVLYFNSYPKLFILVDNNREKIEMFPFITWYLNEYKFKRIIIKFCNKKILYIR